MDFISLELLFVGTLIIMGIAIELGYRTGHSHPPVLKKEREKIASLNTTSVLGMLGFILVFAFGIVYSRYETRKALVKEEANIIRNVWLRADFLPEQDRIDTENKLKRYIDLRLEAAALKTLDNIGPILKETHLLQHQIWNVAVLNARKDMNSAVGALYLESLNDMLNQHANRVGAGIMARIPDFIWIVLYLLVFLGMFSVGYQTSITSSSRRSWLTPVMVLSFTLMIILIASLDRPVGSFITVSQQSLIDVKSWMNEGREFPK